MGFADVIFDFRQDFILNHAFSNKQGHISVYLTGFENIGFLL